MDKHKLALSILATLVFSISTAAQTPCPFSSSEVDPLARCLLRPVKIFGNLGPAPATLPAPLDTLIGKPIDVTAASLKRYLVAHGITEASIGGVAFKATYHDALFRYSRHEFTLSTERPIPCKHQRGNLGRQQLASLGDA